MLGNSRGASADEPSASGATDHGAQPSYLSLPSAAPQRQRGGWSLGGAQGGRGRWLRRRLEWGEWDLQGRGEVSTDAVSPGPCALRELRIPIQGQGNILPCSISDVSWPKVRLSPLGSEVPWAPVMWETWVRCLGREDSPGRGNGNQYSCLENSMDREAQRATVHGVARESDTI